MHVLVRGREIDEKAFAMWNIFLKKNSLGPEMFELLESANKSIKAQIHLKHHQS